MFESIATAEKHLDSRLRGVPNGVTIGTRTCLQQCSQCVVVPTLACIRKFRLDRVPCTHKSFEFSRVAGSQCTGCGASHSAATWSLVATARGASA